MLSRSVILVRRRPHWRLPLAHPAKSLPALPRTNRLLTTETAPPPPTSKPKTARKRERTKIDPGELPKFAVGADGLALKPLGVWDAPSHRVGMAAEDSASSSTVTASASTSSSPSPHSPSPDVSPTIPNPGRIPQDRKSLNLKWKSVLAAKEFPNTPLAREIFENMQLYPGDVLLTRVGMFYESYFSQAPEVASLLNIRLTSKPFKTPRAPSSSSTSPTSPKPKPTDRFPFAGFPESQRSKYFSLLLDLGRSFVVVEERSKPNAKETGDKSKDRFVARRFTRGTMMSEGWAGVGGEETRYLLAVVVGGGGEVMRSLGDGRRGDVKEMPVGLAYIDTSTDRAVKTRMSTLGELEHELARLNPVEVLLEEKWKAMLEGNTGSYGADGADSEVVDLLGPIVKGSGAALSYIPPPQAENTQAELNPEALAETAITSYMQDCLLTEMPALLPANHQSLKSFMQIDASTLLGLEIRQSIRHTAGVGQRSIGSAASSGVGTLLSVIRRTLTPSGTRLLVSSLCQPMNDLEGIRERHDLVEALLRRPMLKEDLRDQLKSLVSKRGGGGANSGEISRIVQKFNARSSSSLGSGGAIAGGQHLWDLMQNLEAIEKIKATISIALEQEGSRGEQASRLQGFVEEHEDLTELSVAIEKAVNRSALERHVEDAPLTESAEEEEESKAGSADPGSEEGITSAGLWWINSSQNPELQGLHQRLSDLYSARDDMELELRQKFGLPKLELRPANVTTTIHIRVPVSRAGSLAAIEADPDFPILSNAAKSVKKYVNNAWTVLATSIDETIREIHDAQKAVFEELRLEVLMVQEDLLRNAELLDELDLCLGFAQAADELRLVRPEMTEGDDFCIVNGRHPTVEFGLLSSQSSRNFTPNSVTFHSESPMHIITGPNMAGKSTLLRQAAIMSILAQAGCFVPADSAKLGIVDSVFSRVGARDDLFMDRSTFMMEMHETAHILNRATSKSLVIMDEVGRGTTLKSGIAVAYAALEFILRRIGCRTLFATHYHEIHDMVARNPELASKVEFWCTDVEEEGGRFSYSYRLRPGLNRNSHALKTAEQAGMPLEFLQNATRTLNELEST